MAPECRPLLPAEWAEQSAVMLTWPHPQSDWAEQLDRAEQLYLQISGAIAVRQQLLVICYDDHHRQQVAGLLEKYGVPATAVVLAIAPSNDTWVRDYGPLTVIAGSKAQLLDFRFNAWGDKYPSDLDNAVTADLASAGLFGAIPCQTLGLVLEGGAVETDGQGTLLATRSSVLAQGRNSGMDREQIETQLGSTLGLRRFLWLERGCLSGDDTDGHIDTLARFSDPQTILHVTAHEDDPDREELEAMIAELRTFRQENGSPYRLIPLPPVRPQSDQNGRRLPASYANFLIINNAVLMPIYKDASDSEAIRCIERAFPGREVIPIDCRPLIQQNGSLHCITMQLPKEVRIHQVA
jgi:agmatine/peptidylarginine deiminase